MIVRGKAWKCGDDIDTDQIYPGKYMNINDPSEGAKHLLEVVDPAFAEGVKAGDFIVAGKNFGQGSTRGHALIAMRHIGMGGIIAESFARIFFRNCISEGIPVMECTGIGSVVHHGDELEVDFACGEVTNLTTGRSSKGSRLEDFMLQKVLSGGTIALLKRNFGSGS